MKVTIESSDFGETGKLDVSKLLSEGWIYKDVAPAIMTPEVWELFLTIMGKGNYHILAMTSFTQGGKPFKRGQFIISPEGQKNMRDYSGAKLQ